MVHRGINGIFTSSKENLPFKNNLTTSPQKTLRYSSAWIQRRRGEDFSQYCLFLGGMVLFSIKPTVLVLNIGIPSSVFSCLTSSAFRKAGCHFDHINVIHGCFEAFSSYSWLLWVYNISGQLKSTHILQ